jgi:putative ABC transport system permease protein
MSLGHDVRFALRLLFKDRWFTLMAAVVLALGIGANNAVFTIINGVLLRSLPFPKPDQIMMVLTRDVRGRDQGISIKDFNDWRASARSFSNLSFVFSGSFNVGEEGKLPDQYFGSYVSPNFFTMLGIAPARGRDFTPDEDKVGAQPVVIISSSMWTLRYGRDPDVIGRTIRLNSVTANIIGVMPDGFKFPNDADIWMPFGTLPTAITDAPRQARGYFSLGRLADGVTVEQAQAEMKAIGGRLAAEYPSTNKDLAPYPDAFEKRIVGSQLRTLFWVLMGSVGFVLLIACSNVANLLLTRAAHRINEIGVRVAVGASRWRIVRQLLIESVLLSVCAGALGMVISIGGIRWFDSETQNVGKPYWMVFTMDWRTFSFFLALCLATGVIFGLAPALHISKTNVFETLKEGGRSGSGSRARRWSTGLVIAQLALTLVLLAGAGFMMRSFLTMYRMDIGISTSRLLSMQMILSARKYPSLDDRAAFLRKIDEQFAAVADVQAASTTTNSPFGGGNVRQLEVDGKTAAPGERLPLVTMVSVGARYFDTIGVSPIQGRVFTDTDGESGREGVIVNQRLVTLHLPGQNPVGRQIRLTEDSPTPSQARWLPIVGVVPNVRQRNNNQETEPDPVAYIPHRQNVTMARAAMVLARARTNTGQAAQALREAMRVIDPDLALYNLKTVDELLGQQRWLLRVFSVMFTTFAGIALVLAAVGLYAVTAYSVSQQTREIGVRMVLGAQPGQVIWLFLKRAFAQLGVGLVLGVAGAFGMGRLLQAFLVQTSSRDPVTLASIIAILVVVAIAACIVPAQSATRLDPLVAIRRD